MSKPVGSSLWVLALLSVASLSRAVTIQQAWTQDSDNNGRIDRLVIQFDQIVDITDDGVEPFQAFTVVDATFGCYQIDDTPDYSANNVNALTLWLVEKTDAELGGRYGDTGATPTVTYVSNGNDIVQEAGGGPEVPDGNSVQADDEASPVPVRVESSLPVFDFNIDPNNTDHFARGNVQMGTTWRVTFSEDIQLVPDETVLDYDLWATNGQLTDLERFSGGAGRVDYRRVAPNVLGIEFLHSIDGSRPLHATVGRNWGGGDYSYIQGADQRADLGVVEPSWLNLAQPDARIQDVSGNSAVPNSSNLRISGLSGLGIVEATTLDRNHNGRIDGYLIRFNKAINDDTLVKGPLYTDQYGGDKRLAVAFEVLPSSTFSNPRFYDGDPDEIFDPDGGGPLQTIDGPLPDDPQSGNNDFLYIIFDEDSTLDSSEGDTDLTPELRVLSEKVRDIATGADGLPDVITGGDVSDPTMVDQGDLVDFQAHNISEEDGASPVPLVAQSSKPLQNYDIQTGTDLTVWFSEPVSYVGPNADQDDFEVYTQGIQPYPFEIGEDGDPPGPATLTLTAGNAVNLHFARATRLRRYRATSLINVDKFGDGIHEDGLNIPGSMTDSAGNDIAAIWSTPSGTYINGINVRGFGEIVVNAISTVDRDGNGKIDHIKLEFDKDVDDDTCNFANGWSVTNSGDPDNPTNDPLYDIEIDRSPDWWRAGGAPPLLGDQVNDNIIYIPVKENDTRFNFPLEPSRVDIAYLTRDFNTDATPTLNFTRPTDGSAFLTATDGFSTITEGDFGPAEDQAPPVPIDVLSSRALLDDDPDTTFDEAGKMKGGENWWVRFSEPITYNQRLTDPTGGTDPKKGERDDWVTRFPDPLLGENPNRDDVSFAQVTRSYKGHSGDVNVTVVQIGFSDGEGDGTYNHSGYTNLGTSTTLNLARSYPQDIDDQDTMVDGTGLTATSNSQGVPVRGLAGLALDSSQTKTLDSDQDGYIDGIMLVFNQPVDDSTLGTPDPQTGNVATPWLVVDGDPTINTWINPNDTADTGPNDSVLILRFPEQTATGIPDTDRTPTLTWENSPLRDYLLAGRFGLADHKSEFHVQDGAGAVLVSVETVDSDLNGRIDRLLMVFSEAVNVTDGGPDVFDAFTVVDTTYGTYQLTDAPVDGDYSAQGVGTTFNPFILYLVEKTDAELAQITPPAGGRLGDTDSRPVVRYVQDDPDDDRVTDASGNEFPIDFGVQATDKAGPVLLRVISDRPLIYAGPPPDPTKESPNDAEVVGGTTFTFFFSEPVDTVGVSYDTFDWNDPLDPPDEPEPGIQIGAQVNFSAGAPPDYYLEMQFLSTTTGARWDASDTVNFDDGQTAVRDLAGTPNSAPRLPSDVSIEGLDVSPPELVEVKTIDRLDQQGEAGNDGRLDGLMLTFSENINDEPKLSESELILWVLPRYTAGSVAVDLDGIQDPGGGITDPLTDGILSPGTVLRRFDVSDRVNWYDRDGDGRWTPGTDALWLDSNGDRNFAPGVDDDTDPGNPIDGQILTRQQDGSYKYGRNQGGIIVDSNDGVLQAGNQILNSPQTRIYRLRRSISFAYLDANNNGRYDPGEDIYYLSTNPLTTFLRSQSNPRGQPLYVRPPLLVDADGSTTDGVGTREGITEGTRLRLFERWQRIVWFDSSQSGTENQQWDPQYDALWIEEVVKTSNTPMIDSDGAFSDDVGNEPDVAVGTQLTLFREFDHIVWLDRGDLEWTSGGPNADSLFYDANGDRRYDASDGDILLIRGIIAGDSDNTLGLVLNDQFGFGYYDENANGRYDAGTPGTQNGEKVFQLTKRGTVDLVDGGTTSVEQATFDPSYDTLLVAGNPGALNGSDGALIEPQTLLDLGVTLCYYDADQDGIFDDGEDIYFFLQRPIVFLPTDLIFNTVALPGVAEDQQQKDAYALLLFTSQARQKGILGTGELLELTTKQPGFVADIHRIEAKTVRSLVKTQSYPDPLNDDFSAINEIDGASPIVMEAESVDNNSNGFVDAFRLRYSEEVDDSTYRPIEAQVQVQNFIVTRGRTQARITQEPNFDNDNTIYIQLEEPGGTNYNTGTIGDVTTDSGSPGLISDLVGNEAPPIASNKVSEGDGAPPILINVVTNVPLDQASRRFLPNPPDVPIPIITLSFSEAADFDVSLTLDDLLFVNIDRFGGPLDGTMDIHGEPVNFEVRLNQGAIELRFPNGFPTDPTNTLWDVTDKMNIRDGQVTIFDAFGNKALQLPAPLTVEDIDIEDPVVAYAYFFDLEQILGGMPNGEDDDDLVVVVFSEPIVVKNPDTGAFLPPGTSILENTGTSGITTVAGANGLFELPVEGDDPGLDAEAFVGVYTDLDDNGSLDATEQALRDLILERTGGIATDDRTITVRLGLGPVLTTPGIYAPGTTTAGSPSGIEIGEEVIEFSATQNLIEDYAGREVARNSPVGVDIQLEEVPPTISADGLNRMGGTTYILRESGVLDALGIELESAGSVFIESMTVIIKTVDGSELTFADDFNPLGNDPGSGVSLWRDTGDDQWLGPGGGDVQLAIDEENSQAQAVSRREVSVTLVFSPPVPVPGDPNDQSDVSFWLCFVTKNYDNALAMGATADPSQNNPIMDHDKQFVVGIPLGGIHFLGGTLQDRPDLSDPGADQDANFTGIPDGYESEVFHTWDQVTSAAPRRGTEILPGFAGSSEPTAVLAWELAFGSSIDANKTAKLSGLGVVSFFLPGLDVLTQSIDGTPSQLGEVSVWRENNGDDTFDYFQDIQVGEGFVVDPDTSRIFATVWDDTTLLNRYGAGADALNNIPTTPSGVIFYVVIEVNENVTAGLYDSAGDYTAGTEFRSSVPVPSSLQPQSNYGCMSGATFVPPSDDPDAYKLSVVDPVMDLVDISQELMTSLGVQPPQSVLPNSSPFAVLGVKIATSRDDVYLGRINFAVRFPREDIGRFAPIVNDAGSGLALYKEAPPHYGYPIYSPPLDPANRLDLDLSNSYINPTRDEGGLIVLQERDLVPFRNLDAIDSIPYYYIVLRTDDTAYHGYNFTVELSDPPCIFERQNPNDPADVMTQGVSNQTFTTSEVAVVDLVHSWTPECPTPRRQSPRTPPAEGDVFVAPSQSILPTSAGRVVVGINLANSHRRAYIEEIFVTFNTYSHYWVDDPAGRPGEYDPGIDEIWSDRNNSVYKKWEELGRPEDITEDTVELIDAVDVCLYDGATPGPQGQGQPVYNLTYYFNPDDPNDLGGWDILAKGSPNPVRPWPHFTADDLRPLADQSEYNEAGVQLFRDRYDGTVSDNGYFDDPDLKLANSGAANILDPQDFDPAFDNQGGDSPVEVFSIQSEAPGYMWLHRYPLADHNGDGLFDIQLVIHPFRPDPTAPNTSMPVPEHDQNENAGYDYFLVLKTSSTIAQYDDFQVVIDADSLPAGTQVINVMGGVENAYSGISFLDGWDVPIYEQVATGDGETISFSATLSSPPIVAGSVGVLVDGAGVASDDGNGVIYQGLPDGGSVSIGAVDYVGGDISFNLLTPPSSGSAVVVRYVSSSGDSSDMNSSSVTDPIWAHYDPNGNFQDEPQESGAVTITCFVLSQPDFRDSPGLDATSFPIGTSIQPGSPYAVIAINLEDGYGELETLDSIRVWFNDVGEPNFEPSDLMPLTTNELSGVALYRDTNRNGVFDPGTDQYVDIGTNEIRWFGPTVNPVMKAHIPTLQSTDAQQDYFDPGHGHNGTYIRSWYTVLKPQLGQDIPDDDKRARSYGSEGRANVNGYGGDGRAPLYTTTPPLGNTNDGEDGADYFIVIRTSSTITYGDDFNVSVHYDLHLDNDQNDYVDDITGGQYIDGPAAGDIANDARTKDLNLQDWRINAEIWSDVLIARVPVIYEDLIQKSGVNVVQANSPPIAVLGINMWDGGDDDADPNQNPGTGKPDEHLLSLTIQFKNIDGDTDFSNKDLRDLVFDNINNTESGVMVYYDVPGGIDGVFEPDVDLPLNIDRTYHTPAWVASPDGETYAVRFDFVVDERSRIPDNDLVNGNRGADFYVVIRTSETISNEDDFTVRIYRETITSPSFSYPSPGLMYGSALGQLYTDECPPAGIMSIHTVERKDPWAPSNWGYPDEFFTSGNPTAYLGLTQRALPTDRYPCNDDNNLLLLPSGAVTGDVYYNSAYRALIGGCPIPPHPEYDVPRSIEKNGDNAYGTSWEFIESTPIIASAVTSLDFADLTVPNQTIESDNSPPLPVIAIDITDGPNGIETLNGLRVVIDDVDEQNIAIDRLSGDFADLTGSSPDDGISVWLDADNNGSFDPTLDTFIPANIIVEQPYTTNGETHYPVEVRFRSGQPIDNDTGVPDFFVCIHTRGANSGIHYLDDFKVTVRDIATGARMFATRDTEAFQTAYKITCNVPTLIEDLTDVDPTITTDVYKVKTDQRFGVFALNMFDSHSDGTDGQRQLKTLKVAINQVGSDEDFSLSDLMPLTRDENSGVALWWDSPAGLRNGEFDQNDIPIPLSSISVSGTKQTGFVITMDINRNATWQDPDTGTVYNLADIPDSDSGDTLGGDFFIVLTTSKTVTIGDDWVVSVPSGGIEFDRGNTLKSASTHTVLTEFIAVTVRALVPADLTVDSNSAPIAAFGINLIGPPNVPVTFDGVEVWVNDSDLLAPLLDSDPASGLAPYLDDDPNSEGTFDPAVDSLIGFTSQLTRGMPNSQDEIGDVITLTFTTPQSIPTDDLGANAGYDFYIVFRTGSAITLGTPLYFEIMPGGIITSTGDSNDIGSATEEVSGNISVVITDLAFGGRAIRRNSDPTPIIGLDIGTGFVPYLNGSPNPDAPKLTQIVVKIVPEAGNITAMDFVAVRLYRDAGIYPNDGTQQDGTFLETTDVLLTSDLSLQQLAGETALTAILDLQSSPSPVPEVVDGMIDFFITIETSDRIAIGDAFRLEILPGDILFTFGQSQSSVLTDVITATGFINYQFVNLIPDLVKPPRTEAYVDILSGAYGLLGLNLERGVGSPAQFESITIKVVDADDPTVDALDTLSAMLNDATSGLSLWRDDGPLSEGFFDPTDDTLLSFRTSVDRAQQTATLTLTAGDTVPDNDIGADAGPDYYVAFFTSDKLKYQQRIKFSVPAGGLRISTGDTNEEERPRADETPMIVVGNIPVRMTDMVVSGQTIGSTSPPTPLIGFDLSDSGLDVSLRETTLYILPGAVVSVAPLPADGGVVVNDVYFSLYTIDWTVTVLAGATQAQVTGAVQDPNNTQIQQIVPIGQDVGVGSYALGSLTFKPLVSIFIDPNIVGAGDVYTFSTGATFSPITPSDFEPVSKAPDPVNGIRSGVMLYADDGDGSFDYNKDTPLELDPSSVPTLTTVGNTNMLSVRLTLKDLIALPDDLDGINDLFLAIMTSSTITTGDQFMAMLPGGDLRFTQGESGISLTTRTLTADIVEVEFAELLQQDVPPSSPPTAVLGLNLWGSPLTSHTLDQIEVVFNGLGLEDSDFNPITNDTTSGIALYQDDGLIQGRFDTFDTLLPANITFSRLRAVIQPNPPFPVPQDDLGPNQGYDLYIVIRTSATANPGDDVLIGTLILTFDPTLTGTDRIRTLIDRLITISSVDTTPQTPTITDTLSTEGGTEVLVTGQGFKQGLTVTVGGRSQQDVDNNDTDPFGHSWQINVSADGTTVDFIAPPGPEGRADLLIRNPDGIVGYQPAVFNYIKPEGGGAGLIILRIDPAIGAPQQNVSLTLIGAGFSQDTEVAITPEGTSTDQFDNFIKQTTYISPVRLTVQTGLLNTGTYDIMARNTTQGQVVTLRSAYRVYDLNQWTEVTIALTPDFARDEGGSTITLTDVTRGGHFDQNTTSLYVDDVSVPFQLSATDPTNKLSFTAPPGQAGSKVNILIVNFDQTYGTAELHYLLTDIPGDVNGDGTVDSLDVQAIARHEVGTQPIQDAVLLYYADLNKDGSVDIKDAFVLQQIILWNATNGTQGIDPSSLELTNPPHAPVSGKLSFARASQPQIGTRFELVDLTPLTPSRLVGAGAGSVQMLGINVDDSRGNGFISHLTVRVVDQDGALTGVHINSVKLYRDSDTAGTPGKFDPASDIEVATLPPRGPKGTEFSQNFTIDQTPIPLNDTSPENQGIDYFVVIGTSVIIPTGISFWAEIRDQDEEGNPLNDLIFEVGGTTTIANIGGVWQTGTLTVDAIEPSVTIQSPEYLGIVSSREELDRDHQLVRGTAVDTGGGSIATVQIAYAPAASLVADLTTTETLLWVDSVKNFDRTGTVTLGSEMIQYSNIYSDIYWADDPAGTPGVFEPRIDEVFLDNGTDPGVYDSGDTVVYEGATPGVQTGGGATISAIGHRYNIIALDSRPASDHNAGEYVYGTFRPYRLVDDQSAVGDFSEWSFDMGLFVGRGSTATGGWVVRARGFDTVPPDSVPLVAERVFVIDSDPPQIVGTPSASQSPQGIIVTGVVDSTPSPQIRESTIPEILVSVNGGSLREAYAAGDGKDTDSDRLVDEERLYYWADDPFGTPSQFDPGIDEVFLDDGNTPGIYDGTNTVIWEGITPGIDTQPGSPISYIGNDYRSYWQDFANKRSAWCWFDEPGGTDNFFDVRKDQVGQFTDSYDEMYIDENGNGVLDTGDTPLWLGANGIPDATIGSRLNLMGNDDNDYWADNPTSGTRGAYDPGIDELFRNDGFTPDYYDGTNTILFTGPGRYTDLQSGEIDPATLTFTSNANTGDGTISSIQVSGIATAEVWFVYCTQAPTVTDPTLDTIFTVVGSRSGLQNNTYNLSTMTRYYTDDGTVSFVIRQGSTAFDVDDAFSFRTLKDRIDTIPNPPTPIYPLIDEDLSMPATTRYTVWWAPVYGVSSPAGIQSISVQATDSAGNESTATGTARFPLRVFRATGLYEAVQLSWINPASTDFAGVLIIRKTGSAPSYTPEPGVSPTNITEPLPDGSTIVYASTNTSITYFTDSSLTNGTNYYYAGFAYYADGSYSAPVTATAMPDIPEVLSFTAEAVPEGILLLWQYPDDIIPQTGQHIIQSVSILRGTGGVVPTKDDLTAIRSGDNPSSGVQLIALDLPRFATRFFDTTATGSSAYAYVIFTNDGQNDSAGTSPLFVRPAPSTVLPPTGLKLTRTADGDIILSWQPAPQRDISGYHIYARSKKQRRFTRITNQLVPTSKRRFKFSRLSRRSIYLFAVTTVATIGGSRLESSLSVPIVLKKGKPLSTLEGIVYDALGHRVPDARVTLTLTKARRTKNANKQKKRRIIKKKASTNEKGVFVFDSLPAGKYRVKIKDKRTGSVMVKNIQLDSGVVQTEEFNL